MPYAGIVSSVPLPDLIPMIAGTPKDVLEAASLLTCSELVLVNLVVNGPTCSTRTGPTSTTATSASRGSARRTCSRPTTSRPAAAASAECYYSKKYRPRDVAPDDCIEPVIRDLYKCGVLKEGDKILFKEAQLIEYGNVIFDLDCTASLATVHGYLDDLGIAYCGRYGDWKYIWTDESFLSGEKAALKLLERTR